MVRRGNIMCNNQIIIIKPDFINRQGFSIIKYYLDQQQLNVDSCYLISDYKSYMKAFREKEVENEIEDKTLREKKIADINVTSDAYELMYRNIAILLLIKNESNLESNVYYDKLRAVKVSIRNRYMKQRPYGIFLNYDNMTIVKLVDYANLPNFGNLKLTHINGIHFAPYKNFIEEFDYKFALSQNIINYKNQIHIKIFEKTAPKLSHEPNIDYDYFIKDNTEEFIKNLK